jgi:hypothetical protein
MLAQSTVLRLRHRAQCRLSLPVFCAQGYEYKGAYQYKPTNLTDFVLLSA